MSIDTLAVIAVFVVGFAIWISGLLCGLAWRRSAEEDGWDELYVADYPERYEHDHPALRLVEPPPVDWSRRGNEGRA